MDPAASGPNVVERLRALDQRLVPWMQRAARRSASAAGAPARALGRWEARVAGGRPLRFAAANAGVILLVAVGLAFVGSAVHLQRFQDLAASADEAATGADPDQVDAAPSEAADGGVAVGPPLGGSIEPYAEDRRAALAGLPDDATTAAVVSFDTFVATEEVEAALGQELTARSVQLRIPREGATPDAVEVDTTVAAAVEDAVAVARAAVVAEEEEFRSYLESGTVEDEAFVAEFEAQVDELSAVRNLLDAGTPVVFAVVAQGPVPALRALAERDGVRLVDPAPPEADLARSTFFGLLPQDQRASTWGRPV